MATWHESSMAEVVPAGVEAALAAFRTGLQALKMQRDLDLVSADGARPWSFLVNMPESQARETVEKFSAKEVSKKSSRHGRLPTD